MIKETAPHWVLQDTNYIKPIYLIHRNKYREAAKMERQRNMPQMKEPEKSPEKKIK